MANFSIAVEGNQIRVQFSNVSSDDDEKQVGRVVLKLTSAMGGPVTTVKTADSNDYFVSYPSGGTVSREQLGSLANRITELAPSLTEA